MKVFLASIKVAVYITIMLFVTGCTLLCAAQDVQADNMVIYQRAVGGWPKHINEVKIDYSKQLAEDQKAGVRSDSLKKDATIDNGATVKEIRYLVSAYKKYKNPAYLAAADKGIRYLLKAQYPVGGWPQFYPDSSLYRGQITYNDNAMINVLNLLQDAALGLNDMDVIDRAYIAQLTDAVKRGVNCLILTQVRVNGKLTVWCAQYDQKTLKPAKARAYELPSLSGSESVAITAFLMQIEKPGAAVKEAIRSAVDWFNAAKIAGFRFAQVDDPLQPGGKDRRLIADPRSVIWARFYDIDTNEPFFCGRDGVKKQHIAEIDHERRNGYAWYGNWPQKLLEKEYPSWLKKNS